MASGGITYKMKINQFAHLDVADYAEMYYDDDDMTDEPRRSEELEPQAESPQVRRTRQAVGRKPFLKPCDKSSFYLICPRIPRAFV